MTIFMVYNKRDEKKGMEIKRFLKKISVEGQRNNYWMLIFADGDKKLSKAFSKHTKRPPNLQKRDSRFYSATIPVPLKKKIRAANLNILFIKCSTLPAEDHLINSFLNLFKSFCHEIPTN